MSLVVSATALVLSSVASRAEMPTGMEHCEYPPTLLCPSPKLAPPGAGIPDLCRQLVADGVVNKEGCTDFVASHSCAQLLDAQARAHQHRGSCYGVLMTNCCDEPVAVDVTLDPVRRQDGQPTQLFVYGGGNQNPERIPSARGRRAVRVPPDHDLIVMWVDAEQKFNIPGADLRWQVHGITAAPSDQ